MPITNTKKRIIDYLKKNGVKIYNKIFAPGVFEIPIIISRNINKYDGFIALGCVVKGQTPHFDYISKAVIYEICVYRLNLKNQLVME